MIKIMVLVVFTIALFSLMGIVLHLTRFKNGGGGCCGSSGDVGANKQGACGNSDSCACGH